MAPNRRIPAISHEHPIFRLVGAGRGGGKGRRTRQARDPRPVTRSVLWDSSAILALLDADDADHARAVSMARTIASERRPSFITNYVEAETHALLLRKLGRTLARQWLFSGGLPVLPVLLAEEQKAKEILARHTDKDWTLCDAISFAVLEARRIPRAFTSIVISDNTDGFRYQSAWKPDRRSAHRIIRDDLLGAPTRVARGWRRRTQRWQRRREIFSLCHSSMRCACTILGNGSCLLCVGLGFSEGNEGDPFSDRIGHTTCYRVVAWSHMTRMTVPAKASLVVA